ncbi:hypothetical protein ACE1ET_13000 [Saccharicrinis sp. FJH62]
MRNSVAYNLAGLSEYITEEQNKTFLLRSYYNTYEFFAGVE